MGEALAMRLTDRQWELIEHFFPQPRRRRDGRGRPWASNRACVEGILWVLRTGARWRDLPPSYPNGPTCWRRLRQWEDDGIWVEALQQLLAPLNHHELLQWDETFLDGSFVAAKKGATEWVKPSVGRDKAHGTGRWPGHSSGSATRERFAGRGHAGGERWHYPCGPHGSLIEGRPVCGCYGRMDWREELPAVGLTKIGYSRICASRTDGDRRSWTGWRFLSVPRSRVLLLSALLHHSVVLFIHSKRPGHGGAGASDCRWDTQGVHGGS